MIKPHYGNQSLLKLKRVISLFFSKFSSFLRGCLPCHTKPTDTCVAMSDSEENNNQNTTDIPFPSNPTMTDTPSHKQLITINVAYQLPLKLTATNFILGKHNLTHSYIVTTSLDISTTPIPATKNDRKSTHPQL